MEIIIYALEAEIAPLKKHLSDKCEFFKCGVGAKDLSIFKNLKPFDHVTNIGLCGGKNVGKIYLANKINYKDKSYYPDLLIDSNIEQKEITTLDNLANKKLISDNENLIFDQEAAHIFKEASKFISPHQISFLKIVSDAGLDNYDDIKKQISNIITSNINYIDDYITSSIKYFKQIKYFNIENDLEKYSEILNCSVTMKNQLAQILKYAKICNIEINEIFKDLPDNPTKLQVKSWLTKSWQLGDGGDGGDGSFGKR